ncbi:MocR-like pyridoxine biosynthesis transcription factor PdxR [Fulvivirga ligni]|uniref:MocR-like pyridoxine biosynthesis transcription factor PdxR n=1 Tax=Fulvivirga ligni TaxID=2904246 RepID=UPI001F401B68|nr:PLP-dependent aminotransferase family protein [Fulvivirga ligni]UII23714.1 PLP-dependent aminotransferase family protein [Fulvivirga ligni]
MAQMLPYKTLIIIDRASTVPVYIQITNQFISLITRGLLKSNAALPSSRKLSELLDINRNTVKTAYDELILQGWVESVSRKGLFVLSNLPEIDALSIDKKTNPDEEVALSFTWNKPGITDWYDTNFQERKLTIDDGFPDVRLTPIDSLMREYRSLANTHYGRPFLHYGSARGSLNLRIAISEYLSRTRGLVVDTQDLLITKGSQMAIYLCAQLLLSEGDKIAVGESNYIAANETFRRQKAELVKIPVDDQGMDIDHLEQTLRSVSIKAVYVIPHHHWPTTVTLSMERRLKLLQLARQHHFAIIEDDYDYDFHYRNKPYIPMASIDHHQNVLYLGSICKTFAPGIRVGYLAGPSHFIQDAANIRRFIDYHGDTLLEEALAAMYNNGEMERHFRKSIKKYRKRRDHLCQILAERFKEYLTFKKPDGGMAIWVEFHKNVNLNQLIERLRIQGVKMITPELYNNDGFDKNGLRLGFASLDIDEMDRVMAQMEEAVKGSLLG